MLILKKEQLLSLAALIRIGSQVKEWFSKRFIHEAVEFKNNSVLLQSVDLILSMKASKY